jgi:hypothetical protein
MALRRCARWFGLAIAFAGTLLLFAAPALASGPMCDGPCPTDPPMTDPPMTRDVCAGHNPCCTHNGVLVSCTPTTQYHAPQTTTYHYTPTTRRSTSSGTVDTSPPASDFVNPGVITPSAMVAADPPSPGGGAAGGPNAIALKPASTSHDANRGMQALGVTLGVVGILGAISGVTRLAGAGAGRGSLNS